MSTLLDSRDRTRADWRLVVGVVVAALVVSALIGTRAGAVDGPVESVYIARGHDFPDSLVGAVLAAMEAAPILTVLGPAEGDAIPPATVAELARLRPKEIVILGGPAAVSESVEEQLGGFTDPPGTTRRLAGEDRFGTAVEISKALPAQIGDVAHAATADDATRFAGQTPDAFWQKSEAVDAATLAGTSLEALAPHTFEFTIFAGDWGNNLHYGSSNIFRAYTIPPEAVGGNNVAAFFGDGGSLLAYANATHEGGGSLGSWHPLPYTYRSMDGIGIRVHLLASRGQIAISMTTNGWDNNSIAIDELPDQLEMRLALIENVH